MRTIDPALHTWIAENLINGCAPADLIKGLVSLTIDETQATQAVNAAIDHPYLKAGIDLKTKLQKREALLNTLDYYQRMDPSYLTLERQTLPPFADFMRDHLSKNRPGLFQGAINHWPALHWTLQNLVEKVGADTIVEIQQGRDTTKEYEVESTRLKRQVRFGDFIKRVETEDTNDCYLTANNQTGVNNMAFRHLFEDIGALGDGYLDNSLIDHRAFVWIGPKGTITPLHHDKTHNAFIQIYGKKRFRLFPAIQVPYMYNHLGVFTRIDLLNPDYAQFPQYHRASAIDITVGPGEFLFIPLGWWHHVVSESPSISLSFTNFPVMNQFFDYPNG